MLNLLSLIIGAIALVAAGLAFLPLLGWMNWFIIPVALIGLGIGAVGRSKSGRNLNFIVIIIAVLRLMLGGGIF